MRLQVCPQLAELPPPRAAAVARCDLLFLLPRGVAIGIGRGNPYALAAAGQPGVEHASRLLRAEIGRGRKRIGVTSVERPGRRNLRFCGES